MMLSKRMWSHVPLSSMKTGGGTRMPRHAFFLQIEQWQMVHTNGLADGGAITC